MNNGSDYTKLIWQKDLSGETEMTDEWSKIVVDCSITAKRPELSLHNTPSCTPNWGVVTYAKIQIPRELSVTVFGKYFV